MVSSRKPGDGAKAERRRVPRAVDAAALIGVSRQRLNDMKLNAPWWLDDFHDTKTGWDVCGIAAAQAAFHEREQCEHEAATAPRNPELDERLARAKVEEAEASTQIKLLEKIKRERIEAEAERQLVQWVIVESLLREMLQELRRLWDDFAWAFARQVPPAFQTLCYTKELDQCETLSEAAPLQRAVLKVTEEFERYLHRVPAEVFEDENTGEPALDLDGGPAAEADQPEPPKPEPEPPKPDPQKSLFE